MTLCCQDKETFRFLKMNKKLENWSRPTVCKENKAVIKNPNNKSLIPDQFSSEFIFKDLLTIFLKLFQNN